MKGLEGKVALVTGGSSGIGRSTSLIFAREGTKIVLADIDVEQGQETARLVKKAGGEAIFVRADVSKAPDVEALVQKAVDTYGKLDCAYNNAGIVLPITRLADESEEDWDRLIDINLKGVWLCMKYEIKQMLRQGSGVIVNCSSGAGLKAAKTTAVYSASKHGIIGLTRTAARQYGCENIRINAVCPALIRTPMQLGKDGRMVLDEAWIAELPLGRMGQPEEVAEAVVWLCSDATSFITGAVLTVDGGQSA